MSVLMLVGRIPNWKVSMRMSGKDARLSDVIDEILWMDKLT